MRTVLIALFALLLSGQTSGAALVFDNVPIEFRTPVGCEFLISVYGPWLFARRDYGIPLEQQLAIPFHPQAPQWWKVFMLEFAREVWTWPRDPDSFAAFQLRECLEGAT